MFRLLSGIALCTMVAGMLTRPLLAATTTATSLSVTPANLAPGKPAKLVATVTDPSNKSVFPGTVTFYDGTRLLGTAQIVSHTGGSFAQGTATLNIASFDAGANSITAVFAGTKSYVASTSPTKTVTVTGQSPTATTLAVTGTSGNYSLTGTVEAFGAAAPAGNLEFLNDMTKNSLGLLSLSGAQNGGSYVVGSKQPSTSGSPVAMAAVDLNGDGLLDMVLSNYSASGLNFYLGHGDGTFAAPTQYSDSHYSIYFGDFNNDGILDMMSVNGPSVAQISLGNGDGTFKPLANTSFGATGNACSYSIDGAVADLDHDGILDFVVSGVIISPPDGAQTSEICVIRGNGDGTFKAPQVFMNVGGSFVQAADLNGDGYPDLVIGSGTAEAVLLGNGDGTFQAPATLSGGNGPFALGDLNGDGIADVVVGNPLLSTITVSLGKGDGSFRAPVSYPAKQNYNAPPLILDVNGDGKPDIAVTNQTRYLNENGLSVLLGNGDGTFKTAAEYLEHGEIVGVPVLQGDFNGDGLPDLLTIGIPEYQTYVATVFLDEKSYSVTLPAVTLPGPGTSSAYSYYTGDSNYLPSTSCDVSPGVKPQLPSFGPIYADHITSTTASIGWTSTFPTNGYVGYGTKYDYYYPPNVNDPTYFFAQNTPWQRDATTFHFVTLTGLTPGTLYYFAPTTVAYFAGCDHWSRTSGLYTFTTATQ